MSPAQGVAGCLVVCPTPIGNLEDITLRTLRALREADVIACEDTRRTRTLLDHYGIRARLESFHDHNEHVRADELVQRMHAGATVALVADAGTPLVSDPGFALLAAALGADIPIEVLPGPSAVLPALVASGLPAERWCFVGFLPRPAAPLLELLLGAGETLVAFESPRRLQRTLALLAERDPARAVAVCRELTKLHEEVRRGSAAELASHFSEHPARGEVVLVVSAAGTGEGRPARAAAVRALRALVDAGARPRPAAAALAKLTGLAANELYRSLTEAGQ
jgi:16S rRNA (cytidine1402-2'-O)-methyltransferase